MPSNSFRLFVVSLHDGQSRPKQKFDDAVPRVVVTKGEDGKNVKTQPASVDYRSQLVSDVNAHKGHAFVFGAKVVEDDEDEPTATTGHVLRWNQATQKKAASRMWFEAGPVTKEGVLVDPQGNNPDLDFGHEVRATLHKYRAALVTKEGYDYAILAVEARGARCPKDQLVRALRESSDQPWSLRIREGVAQKAAILEYITQANVAAVTFTEYGYGRDGGKKAPQLKRLRVDEVTGGIADIKNAAKKWIIESWKGAGAAAAANLLDLVVTEEVNISFNDVAVEFDDDNQRRTIRPSYDYRRFGYFLGKQIVNDKKFFKQVGLAAETIIDEIQAIVPEDN